MSEPFQPILNGKKALVIGIANDQSIAYVCPKTFRKAGAELAVTWLNEKARRFVEPLAEELGASISGALISPCPARWRRCRRGRAAFCCT
jgi:enoyl-[acyl-carrier protein] reductase I